MIAKIVAVATLVSVMTGVAASLIGGLSFFAHGAVRLQIFLIVTFLVDAILLYGAFDRRAPIFGRIFWKGNRDLCAISISFDDGPNEPFTSQILDVLKAFGIKATFFVVGQNVEAFPDALRREVGEGHEIGNHTYDHEVLPLKSPGQIRSQLARTNDLVEKITGARPRLFRAPHGWRNPWVNRSACREGCVPVAWTLGVWDTDRPGTNAIVERTLNGLKGLKDGCVLLLHDGRGVEHGIDTSQLVSALPQIITKAREEGYRFITLSEMVKESESK